MKIVLIGAGNVATSLALSLLASGHEISQIYSRTLNSAAELALKVGAKATDLLDDIHTDCELYICSLKDDALVSIVPQLCPLNGIVVHTAGSIPMDLFESSLQKRFGVLYPFQTFSKQIAIPFSEVPLFIEGSDEEVVVLLETLSDSLQAKHWKLSSDERKWLHLAGVYASNFTNYMFTMSEQILTGAGLPFEIIVPLIKETVRKVETHRPHMVQTGPAIREDYDVMNRHIDLLSTAEDRKLYSLLSQQIINHKEKSNDRLRFETN